MIDLDTALQSIITQKRRVSALRKLGMITVRDVLTNYPFRVEAPQRLLPLGQMVIGTQAAAYVRVVQCTITPVYGRGGSRLEALVEDMPQTGAGISNLERAQLVYFSRNRGFTEWMSGKLQAGTELVISGTPSVFNGRLQFTHPEIVVTQYPYTQDTSRTHSVGAAHNISNARALDSTPVQEAIDTVTKPRPIYHANSGISKEHVHETVMNVLKLLAQQSPMHNYLAVEERNIASHSSTPQGSASHSSALHEGASHDGAVHIGDPHASITHTSTTSTNNINAAALSVETNADSTTASPLLRADDLAYIVPDIIPEDVRVQGEYMHRAEAFLAVHCPQTVEEYKLGLRTLRFEEALISQTALLATRQQVQQGAAYACLGKAEQVSKDGAHCASVHSEQSHTQIKAIRTPLVQQFIDSLPFTLTHGQQTVIDDIVHDMNQPFPMQRLLQGEVGSGKTVVAVAAMLQAVGAGYQAVLVAPTQVLAEQHMQSIRHMLAHTDIPVVLLTGSLKLRERRQVLAQAASGEPCIIIATHAAFSKSFQAPNLALVVIDEQHRFGVQQREALRKLNTISPHVLVMTATPIPRTAAMTWFGDLDISWLTELPGGRKPITTVLVHEDDGYTMQRMFQHIRARIDAGERAYIVCPRIDADTESDALDNTDNAGNSGKHNNLGDEIIENNNIYHDDESADVMKCPMHSVAEIAERLQSLQQLQGIRCAVLTGRDDEVTKQRVMQEFADGTTPILIATTVIEVGVDVPQASCIVIFDADHFGLSQLHQLRGRVGRGGTKSWAFLVSHTDANSPAAERLQVIKNSTDGAEIAQEDLRLRGEGDVLGDTQAGGRSSFKLLRVVADADLIQQARAAASVIVQTDHALHEQSHIQLAGAVLDFMRGNEQYLTSN